MRPLGRSPKDEEPLWSEPVSVELDFEPLVPDAPEGERSRELGALRPLGRSLKDEEPLLSEPVAEELDLELVVPDAPEADEEPLLFEPISEELDLELVVPDAPPPDELADPMPSDFAVSESSLPVGLMLLAL